MPHIIGSTTFSTAAAVMAASTALPPSMSTRRPAADASGWLVAIMPFRASTDERPRAVSFAGRSPGRVCAASAVIAGNAVNAARSGGTKTCMRALPHLGAANPTLSPSFHPPSAPSAGGKASDRLPAGSAFRLRSIGHNSEDAHEPGNGSRTPPEGAGEGSGDFPAPVARRDRRRGGRGGRRQRGRGRSGDAAEASAGPRGSHQDAGSGAQSRGRTLGLRDPGAAGPGARAVPPRPGRRFSTCAGWSPPPTSISSVTTAASRRSIRSATSS